MNIALDASGNAYVGGWTSSSDFPSASGAFNANFNGDEDAFITKLNPDGSALVYSTFIGGTGDDGGGIALDALGNIYVAGHTNSSDFPTTAGTYDTSYNGDYDIFVAKLNSTGNALVYSTFLGGSGDDFAGITLDGLGNAYLAGDTSSSNFPTTNGSYDTSYNGGFDAFVTKLNSAGNALVYSTFLGGSGDEDGTIAIDASGNVYVVGTTYVAGTTGFSDFPTTAGAYDTSYNGGEDDAFVAKLDLTPAWVAATAAGENILTDFGGSISLTFASVSLDGWTTMTTSDSAPATQSGFEINGVYYDFDTTATYTGPITVTLPYDPNLVEDPLTLAIFHYDAALNTWVDVTTEIDTINHTITGVVDSLSWFAVGQPHRTFEFREPINSDGSSVFQLGQTIPVKFQLTDQDGNSVPDVIARIYLAKVSNGIAGTEQEAIATNAPDSGNTFRYNSSFNQYIFNLGTKNLSAGTWKIRISLDHGISYTVLISLSAK